MKNRTKSALTAAALAALTLLTACAASAVSLEEAQKIALDAAGIIDAVFTQRHLDPDDGVYEIAFTSGGVEYEFEVDAQTGAIRETDLDNIHSGAVPTATIPPESTAQASITLEQAKAIAYAHAGVSEADAYDRSAERDGGIFEVDFEYGGVEYEYDIAADGTILKSEQKPAD